MVVGECKGTYSGVEQEAKLGKMLLAAFCIDGRGSERELLSTFSAARIFLFTEHR